MFLDDSTRRQVTAAAIVASLVVSVSDLTYRAVILRASSSIARTPIDPAAMRHFPLRIGEWVGREVPVDEAVARAIGTDAHLSRAYTRRNGFGSVALYVATAGKVRGLISHRPEICYVSGGWTPVDRRPMALGLKDGKNLPCTVFQFTRGGLTNDRKMVLYYYMVDGQYCKDVSSLRSKVWYGSDRVEYAVQVQVIASFGGSQTADFAIALVSAFAAESAPLIAHLFNHHETGPNISEARPPSGEGM